MSIILLVTGHAAGRQLVAIEIPAMARIALDPRVPASQWIFRRLVMIEMSRLPHVLIVTGLALGSVSSGVNILNLMAIHAQGTDALVAFANMARRAGDRTVCAQERKLGRVVIERLDLAPCDFAVAIVAFLAKAPLVRIFRLMTVETAPSGLSVLRVPCVAAVATCTPVGADQCEVGECMVEGFTVQLDDVERAPFVFGVARLALAFRRFGVAAVETACALPIRSDRLVARQAKPGLRLTRKGLVAAVAVLFKLRVPIDERSWHHQLLENAL